VSAAALANVIGEIKVCAGLHYALGACGPFKAVQGRIAIGA
jgi:hypothetical protein